MRPSPTAQAPAGGIATDRVGPAGRLVMTLLGLAMLARVLAMLASGAGLFVDEAQYWDWSRALAWGYWSKPPGIAVVVAASTRVFGDDLVGVRLLAMACWPLTGAVLYGLGRSMGGPWTGAWAAVLFIGTLGAGVLGMVATTDGPLLLFWTVTMACCWAALHARAAGSPAWAWWCLAGVAAGLGLLTKYTMAAAALTALWLARRHPRARGGLALASGVAALLFAPHLAWNAANGWPTLGHTAQITIGAQRQGGGGFVPALVFAAGQVLLLGPVAIWTALRLLRRPAPTPDGMAFPRAFAVAWSLPILCIGLAQALLATAQVNWAAPFLAGSCLWLALRAGPAWGERGLLQAWGAGVLLAVVLSQLGQATGRTGLDLWSRMRGWQPALQSLAPALQSHPGTPVAASRRDLIAHATYAWRELGVVVSAWPAEGAPRNHYEQFRPLRSRGQPWPAQVLVLTTEAPPASTRRPYRDWRLLASARSGAVDVQLWLATHPEASP